MDWEEQCRSNRNYEHLRVAIHQQLYECFYNEAKDRLFVLSDLKRIPGGKEAKLHFQCSLSLNGNPPKPYSDHSVKATIDLIEKHPLLKENIKQAECKLAEFLKYASQVKIQVFITQLDSNHFDQIDFHVYVMTPLCAGTTMALVSQVVHSLKEIRNHFFRSEKIGQTCSSMWF